MDAIQETLRDEGVEEPVLQSTAATFATQIFGKCADKSRVACYVDGKPTKPEQMYCVAKDGTVTEAERKMPPCERGSKFVCDQEGTPISCKDGNPPVKPKFCKGDSVAKCYNKNNEQVDPKCPRG